jgi:hypothetical protein
MASKLICYVFREWCLACLYAVFRDCGRPAAESPRAAASLAVCTTFIYSFHPFYLYILFVLNR